MEDKVLPSGYRRYIEKKRAFVLGLLVLTALAFLWSLTLGVSGMGYGRVLKALFRISNGKDSLILWNIRLPQALSGVLAGGGLSLSGVAMQAILKNPLGSPFTLGFSHAGAFGAALTIMLLSEIPYVPLFLQSAGPGIVAFGAFLFCLLTSWVILAVAKAKGARPETMVLCGVALSSLFTAGTMFLQFFADDSELAATVFWTFGDLARAEWRDIGVMALVMIPGGLYFYLKRWDFNGLEAGDEVAMGLGIDVESLRLRALVVAALMVSVSVAYLGVIGFVGLVSPHFIRRVMGDDYRWVVPGCAFFGAFLLLAADGIARVVMAPHVLPVAVLTSFLGAPAFLWLLVRGRKWA